MTDDTQNTPTFIDKVWGAEQILPSNDQYSVKLLKFRATAKLSLHFHLIKDETFYVVSGTFNVTVIDGRDATKTTRLMGPGDYLYIARGTPHTVEALEDGVILEASDTVLFEDSYRIQKSQPPVATST